MPDNLGTLWKLSVKHHEKMRNQAKCALVLVYITSLIGIICLSGTIVLMATEKLPVSKSVLVAAMSIQVIPAIGLYIYARICSESAIFHASLERALIKIIAKEPLRSFDLVEGATQNADSPKTDSQKREYKP